MGTMHPLPQMSDTKTSKCNKVCSLASKFWPLWISWCWYCTLLYKLHLEEAYLRILWSFYNLLWMLNDFKISWKQKRELRKDDGHSCCSHRSLWSGIEPYHLTERLVEESSLALGLYGCWSWMGLRQGALKTWDRWTASWAKQIDHFPPFFF